MPKIVRSIGAVIGGFVAASAVMLLVESVNGHVLYPELGKLALVFFPAALFGARLAPKRDAATA